MLVDEDFPLVIKICLTDDPFKKELLKKFGFKDKKEYFLGKFNASDKNMRGWAETNSSGSVLTSAEEVLKQVAPSVKDVVKYEVGTFVGLEQIPVADHISDYESDQSDEAMAAAEQQVHNYMMGQRQKNFSRFLSRHMFFYVFLKVKGGLFSCIFCLNDSFICKFGVF